MIVFKCPKCGVEIGMPESLSGQTKECPSCGNVNCIPAEVASPSSPIAQPTTPRPEIKTNVKQGAIIGGWLCFILGLFVMYTSVWLFLIYGPLLLVALILSVVAMAQHRVILGIALLLSTLVIPPVLWLVLSAQRTTQVLKTTEQALRQS